MTEVASSHIGRHHGPTFAVFAADLIRSGRSSISGMQDWVCDSAVHRLKGGGFGPLFRQALRGRAIDTRRASLSNGTLHLPPLLELFHTIVIAAVMFAATNADDLVLLALFFSQPKASPRAVVVGQLVGIGSLTAVSYTASVLALAVPHGWLP
jgi:hypothetical protein